MSLKDVLEDSKSQLMVKIQAVLYIPHSMLIKESS